MLQVDVDPAILIVEDDELVRSFLCRALAGVAGDVDACPTGATALAAAKSRRFGLILLDGLLPDIHGIDLGRLLVAAPNSAGTAICFVSGMLRHPHAMRHGIAALPKPLRVRDLVEVSSGLLQWYASGTATPADRLATLSALASELMVS